MSVKAGSLGHLLPLVPLARAVPAVLGCQHPALPASQNASKLVSGPSHSMNNGASGLEIGTPAMLLTSTAHGGGRLLELAAMHEGPDAEAVRNVPAALSLDAWYAALADSVAIELFSAGMPAGMRTTGYVPFDGLQEIADRLRIDSPRSLIDLGCGLGWPGLWVARSLGASLTGVDYASAAVTAAAEIASREFPAVQATFIAADATATGLGSAGADATMSLDVVQLVGDRAAFFAEVSRVLRPGGRLAVTTWEAFGSSDAARYPRDLAAEVAQAGLIVELVEERPRWVDHHVSVYESALAAEADHPDDGPLKRLVAEARAFFARPERRRRLLVVARTQSQAGTS